MRTVCRKIADVLKVVFGYGIAICLFAGGMTFFGYLAALCIGGETAEQICTVIYKTIIPYIIRCSTVLVLLGLVVMYLSGQKALTAEKKKSSKHQGEM